MAISPNRDSSTPRELGFPLSRVYGVTTFYHLLQCSPPGRYLVRICKGTVCHVNRSAEIRAQVHAQLGIREGETIPDGLLTLQTVPCMGAYSLAPVMVVNDRTYGQMTPAQACIVLAQLQAKASGEGTQSRKTEGGTMHQRQHTAIRAGLLVLRSPRASGLRHCHASGNP